MKITQGVSNFKEVSKRPRIEDLDMKKYSNISTKKLRIIMDTINNKDAVSATISTYNRFTPLSTVPKNAGTNILNNSKSDDITDSQIADNITVKKVSKLPPIIIQNKTHIQIYNIMEDLNVKFVLKLMSVDIKCIFNNNEDFNKVMEYLKANKISFYTFAINETKPIKFLLSGLPKVESKELLQELKQLNVDCLDIKMFTPRHNRYDDHVNYLIYVDRSKTKLSDLREIKSVFHVIVKWEYYSNNRIGPTQCRRCQMFGHGTQNCNLVPRCVICAEEHLTSDCPLNQSENTNSKSDNKDKLKCINCNENHTANYSGCSKRIFKNS